MQQESEENILSSIPQFKLYKDTSISIGTFFGGPLVAGYLAATNFQKLGQPRKAKVSWIISISFTIVMLSAIFMIPEIENVPNYIIPLLYTAITQALVQKYQKAAIEAHIDSGGQMYSAWRAAGIGLLGLALLFIIIILIILVTEEVILQ